MQQRYKERFRKVIHYIHQHLDESVSLDDLAAVAHFSKYHFQRQFSAMFGLSPIQYCNKLDLSAAPLNWLFARIAFATLLLIVSFKAMRPLVEPLRELWGRVRFNLEK